MSEPENFLDRWSRRKLEAEEQAQSDRPAPEKADTEKAAPEAGKDVPGIVDAIAGAAQPEFDVASLPPIESIDAATDIRAFLAPGVPAALTRAALRRAWMADPTIRDFIGIAENQWDFTKPDGVPGFGTLPLGAEVRQIVANLLEAVPHEPLRQGADQVAQPAETSGKVPPGLDAPLPAATQAGDVGAKAAAEEDAREASDGPEHGATPDHECSVALQDNRAADDDSPRIAHRRHGSAIPR